MKRLLTFAAGLALGSLIQSAYDSRTPASVKPGTLRAGAGSTSGRYPESRGEGSLTGQGVPAPEVEPSRVCREAS